MSGAVASPPASPLPRLLVLTDRTQAPRPLALVLHAAVAGGARAVVVREKDLPRADRAAIAAAIRPVVTTLLVASDPSIPADGTHLAAADPMPEPRPGLVGRSCHDAADVARATREGCDYLTVSPIFATASKPGYGPAIGIEGLRALAAGTTVPVYALGGLTPERVAACLDAGAHGVAVMGQIMRAADPAATVAAFLSRIGTLERADPRQEADGVAHR